MRPTVVLQKMFLLFISTFMLMLAIAPTHAGEAVPFPSVALPVYPGAINPEINLNSPAKGAKTAVYRVTMPFPADEITSFYDTELQKIGYKRFTEDSRGTFQWMSFNNKSGEWEKVTETPARYTAAWVDGKKKTIIWLYIAYKDNGEASWKESPFVTVNMSKFSQL